MRSKNLFGRLFLSACLAAICAGCINYREEIALNKDCSGTITLEYVVSEDFAAVAEQKEKEAKGDQSMFGLPFSEEQAQRIFNIEKVLSITYGPVISKSAEKGYRKITITCEFDDINNSDFPTIPLFEGGSISFTEDEQGNLVFKRILRSAKEKEEEGDEDTEKKPETKEKPAEAPAPEKAQAEPEITLDEDASDAGDTLAKSVFAEYKLKFVVNFPGRILKTNGVYYEEGEQPSAFEWLWGHRKAVWEFRLADIAKKGELTATIKNRWPWEWIIIISIVLVALALIVIKSKPGAAEAEADIHAAQAKKADESKDDAAKSEKKKE